MDTLYAHMICDHIEINIWTRLGIIIQLRGKEGQLNKKAGCSTMTITNDALSLGKGNLRTR